MYNLFYTASNGIFGLDSRVGYDKKVLVVLEGRLQDVSDNDEVVYFENVI